MFYQNKNNNIFRPIIFSQANCFKKIFFFYPSWWKNSTSKYFPCIMEVFYKQIFLSHQERFPSSRKFCFIKELFHRQIFFMIINVFLKLSIKILRKNILTRMVIKRSYISSLTVGLCNYVWPFYHQTLKSYFTTL